ncbi:MAG: hypothetical protein KDA95_04150 [Acidimicrobiales bacterium]|nr:hypothetical protein [Acidimicrobiales bacterium]
MKKTLTAAAVALSLTVSIAGCSDKKDDSANKGDKTAQSTTTAAGTATPGTNSGESGETFTDVRDPQGSVEDYVGAMQDAKLDACAVADGALKANGTVTNPLDEAQQYRIYVSAMEGTDTRGIVQVDLPSVEGGQSADWTAEFELADEGLSCLLRVERFAPIG